MNNYGKRIINVRTPVVLYDKAIPADDKHSDFSSKFQEILASHRKLEPLNRKNLSAYNENLCTAEIANSVSNIVYNRLEKSHGALRKLAVLKKTNMKLEGYKSAENKLSTYQQILNKIASRFTNSKNSQGFIKRKYSNNPSVYEKSFSPIVFKSQEDPCHDFMLISLPKRKRIHSVYSRKNLAL